MRYAIGWAVVVLLLLWLSEAPLAASWLSLASAAPIDAQARHVDVVHLSPSTWLGLAVLILSMVVAGAAGVTVVVRSQMRQGERMARMETKLKGVADVLAKMADNNATLIVQANQIADLQHRLERVENR